MADLHGDPVRTRQVRRLQEMFHGRFTEDEIAITLEEHGWNEEDTMEFIFTSDPRAIRQLIYRTSTRDERYIRSVQSDPNIIEDVRKSSIPYQRRLFACGDCDNPWWRIVPSRKPVSTCRICRVKYDPVPRDKEWGWACFNCRCGNSFSGWGQQDTTSNCHQCRCMVNVSEIRPPERRVRRRSHQMHSCDAPDCGRYFSSEHRHRGIATGRIQKTCVSPLSRRGKAKVIYPSRRHRSTGSTVDTFLSQDGLGRMIPFTTRLRTIQE